MVRAAVLPAVGAPVGDRRDRPPGPRPRTGPHPSRRCRGLPLRPVPQQRHHARAGPGGPRSRGRGHGRGRGEGVTHVAPGDPVILNWAPSCGTCHACALGEVWLCANALNGAADVYAHRSSDGSDLHPGLNVAAFAEETVVAAACVLPLPEGIPLTDAALLGCAVLTGYGAIHHSAQVRGGRRSPSSASEEWACRLSSRPGSRAPRRSSPSMSPRRRRSWPARPERRTTWSPPRTRPARSEPSPENRALTSPSSASAEPSPSAPPGNPPAGAAVRQSSVSAARTSRSPSTRSNSSTGEGR